MFCVLLCAYMEVKISCMTLSGVTVSHTHVILQDKTTHEFPKSEMLKVAMHTAGYINIFIMLLSYILIFFREVHELCFIFHIL